MSYYTTPIVTLDSVLVQSLLQDAPTVDGTATTETIRATMNTNMKAYIKDLLPEITDMMQKAYNRSLTPYKEAKVFYEAYLRDDGMRYDRYLGMSVFVLNHGDGDDCLSISAFDWNGTALTSSDYRFVKPNESPNSEIIFNETTSLAAIDSFDDSVTITGVWGYHDNVNNMWADSGDTVLNATEISASATTITVADGGNFEIYQLIRIEDEYLFIIDIAGAFLTVERGKNGTVAASHVNTTQIDTFVPIPAIAKECRRLVLRAWFLRNNPMENLAFSAEQIREIVEGEINTSIIPRLMRTYSF